MIARSEPYSDYQLRVLASRTRHALGMIGELYARQLIEQGGYIVKESTSHNGDLLVIEPDTGETLKIEVKTAKRGKDKKWRFTLWKKGHTNHRNADIVLLLAVTKSGQFVPFVVPVDAIKDKSQACITSHPVSYAGQYAKYRIKNLNRVGCKCWESVQ